MSSESQRYSLVNQAEVIRHYAELHGFEVVQTYEDAGRSGVTAERRLGLAALLSDVVSGAPPFSTILVLDVSRWGRYQDPDEAAHYEFLCRTAGVAVRYCAEDFGEGYGGSIMKQLKRVMAGEYSRELSEKVRKSKRLSARLGHAPGGPCPFGLQRREFLADGSSRRVLARDERKSRPELTLKLEPGCPKEQAVVLRIFDAYVRRRKHPQEIARQLLRDGIVWSDGTAWTSKRVSRTLQTDLLAGQRLVGKTAADLGKRRTKQPREDWVLVSAFAPVVPLTLFKAAERRRLALAGSKGRTTAELLRDLRRVWKKHGRISAKLIDETYCSGRVCSYLKRFGSLRKAYDAIDYPYTGPVHAAVKALPSEAVLIAALKQVHKKFGRVTVRLLERERHLPSPYFMKRVFGSMPAAYAAAGLHNPDGRAVL